MTFAEILRAVPNIHVFGPASKFDQGGVTVLTLNDNVDTRYKDRQYSEDYTKGDGSRENPFRYKSAAPVSAYYGVVDLWFRFRDQPVFIKVNDWLLEVSPEGVTAMDGHFTRLV